MKIKLSKFLRELAGELKKGSFDGVHVSEAYKFQLEGIKAIKKNKYRTLLADEMGLGKTFQVIRAMESKLEEWDGPVVVICPAGLKHHWRKELMHHAGIPSEILSGKNPPKVLNRKAFQHKVYIINYDILGNPVKGAKSWVRFLSALKPALVVVDECHYIKSRVAQRTKAVRWLCRNRQRIIMISGTPLTNRPAELWPVINCLWPEKFKSFFSYAVKHCDPQKTPWGWRFPGATNLPQLHRKLKKCGMIRRLKRDVLSDLPVKMRTVLPVDIPNKREYETAEREFIAWLMRRSRSKAMRAMKSERLVKLGYLKRLAAELKIPQVISWIKDFLEESNGKLLVFGIHVVVLDALQKAFPGICVRVDGSVTGANREAAVEAFNTDKKIRLFFGNIDAAGVGWSCRSASDVLFAELSWVPGKHIQAEDRIHGIKRGVEGKKSSNHYLVAKGTIEEKLCMILQDKQGVLDRVLDGNSTGRELDILTLLEDSMLRGAA